MLIRRVVLVLLLAQGVPASAADPVEDLFAARGPFDTVSDLSTGPGGDFSILLPADPGLGGVKHPVITWGNGTFSTPVVYFDFLDHLASHGFVVIASNSVFTGSGEQMLAGVDWILEQNEDPDSPLFDAIDVDSIGATGHSQGGEGTINAANDPRIVCSAPIQPVPGNVAGLRGPMFVLAGEEDRIVPARRVATTVYRPSQVPTVFGVLAGSTHLDPVGDADGYRGYVTAWFAACLAHDAVAASAFVGPCSLCDNPSWTVFRKRESRSPSDL